MADVLTINPRKELAITRSERWMDFHTLRMQGLSIRKIAAFRGVSRNAVRRALRSFQARRANESGSRASNSRRTPIRLPVG